MSFTRIIETGSYTGNGATGQSISIGWQPAVVWIVSTGAMVSNRAWSVKIDTMPTDVFLAANSTATAETGITLTADGFSVDGDLRVNDSGTLFFWVAFRAGPTIDTARYTGDDAATRTFTEGRQPALVLITATVAGVNSIHWKLATNPNKDNVKFTSSLQRVDAIDVLPTGFSVDDAVDHRLNQSGDTYDYMVFYEFDGSTRQFEASSYNGNDTFGVHHNTKKITTGLKPKWVMLHKEPTGATLAFVTQDYPTTNTSVLAAEHEFSSLDEDRVEILSDGFEVRGNYNVDTETYHYVAGYF